MPAVVRAHLLPTLVEPEQLRGRVTVVIDVLRATTTIIHAIANGAECVVPCLEVDEARRAAEKIGPAALLGGERGGTRIDGFDLGNSPAEYVAERVAGRTIVFTTTNGTRAMLHCRLAARVLIGSFVNRAAVVAAVKSSPEVDIVCAGTDGVMTREDVLLAGAFVDAIVASAAPGMETNDEAQIARDAWLAVARRLADGASLADELRDSRGGRNLVELGYAADIALAAHVDRFSIVPELDVPTWRIRAANEVGG